MSVDLETRHEIANLYASYAACVDDGRYEEWPEFFTSDAWYRVVSRENFDRDLPLSTLSLKGQPMMRDRIYGITSTIFHAPYYQRHVIGYPLISADEGGGFSARANYSVIRTKRDMAAEIYSIGQYIDAIEMTADGPKFSRKFCVFDNDIIPNSLIYPI